MVHVVLGVLVVSVLARGVVSVAAQPRPGARAGPQEAKKGDSPPAHWVARSRCHLESLLTEARENKEVKCKTKARSVLYECCLVGCELNMGVGKGEGGR